MYKSALDSTDRKHALNAFRPTQTPRRLRQKSLWIVLAFWLVLSAYPSYLYWICGRSHAAGAAARARATVTESIAVPALSPTALPGALSANASVENRTSDVVDTFRHFNKSAQCQFSSLDIHGPFEPLCSSKHELLQAMSGGGRLGVDAPFSPRGCDMRWFSTEEICDILSRFESVFVIGDSMMRNLAVAIHVFLRADLVNGGRTTWQDDPTDVDCSCAGPFETSRCSSHSVATSHVVLQKDPLSYKCPQRQPVIQYNVLLEYPIKEHDLNEFLIYVPSKRPTKPVAFVMGSGLWNDLIEEETTAWMDQIVTALHKKASYLKNSNSTGFKLFLPPNAAGPNKPFIFQARQGNIALARFEDHTRSLAQDRGFDHLGTFNASVQTYNPDGTHGSMKVNLLKAMMVLNWLNALEV